MNDDVTQTGRDLEAAAAVFGARRRIDSAIAELAASPLDVAAGDRMRKILASPDLRRARRALRGLVLQQRELGKRPHLTVVTEQTEDPDDLEEPVRAAVVGGVA